MKVRLDHLLFGYEIFEFNKDDELRIINLLLKNGLSANPINGKILVPIWKAKKYKDALREISFSSNGVRGVPGFFIENRKRYGLYVSFIFLLTYFLFTAGRVWDIRVEGAEEMSYEEVIEELDSVGFYVGSRWNLISQDKVEVALLEKSDKIGWLSINRKGTVAYVTVKEKHIPEISDDYVGYSNIVAACDCIIEDITVKSGIAMVKKGDTVKEGELIISGIIPSELGGGCVRAEGEVYGRLTDKIEVEVPRRETISLNTEERVFAADVKIFDFSINIFKKSRNLGNHYDIIEKVNQIKVLGKYKLPISLVKRVVISREDKEIVYSDSELVKIAKEQLSEQRDIDLKNAEIIKMRTEGSFTDNGYVITSYVTSVKNIGNEERIID